MRYSVIIPVFNRARTLERAVAGALTQTVPPQDIVIVDDGSSDASVAIAEQLAALHGCIQVVRLPGNAGAPTARNVGVGYAGEDMLAFLDSDDAWLPDKAASQLAMLADCPGAPAAFTGILVLRPDGSWLAEAVPALVQRHDLFERNVLGGTSSAMIRRTAFVAVGGFVPDMPSCQDWDLWLRLAKLGPLAVCPTPLTLHYLDSDNRITTQHRRVIEGQNRITAQLRSELSGRELARVAAAHDFNVASILLRQAKCPRAALFHVLRGWGRRPSSAATVRVGKLVARAISGFARSRAWR